MTCLSVPSVSWDGCAALRADHHWTFLLLWNAAQSCWLLQWCSWLKKFIVVGYHWIQWPCRFRATTSIRSLVFLSAWPGLLRLLSICCEFLPYSVFKYSSVLQLACSQYAASDFFDQNKHNMRHNHCAVDACRLLRAKQLSDCETIIQLIVNIIIIIVEEFIVCLLHGECRCITRVINSNQHVAVIHRQLILVVLSSIKVIVR